MPPEGKLRRRIHLWFRAVKPGHARFRRGGRIIVVVGGNVNRESACLALPLVCAVFARQIARIAFGW